MKHYLYTLLLLLPLTFQSCESSNDEPTSPDTEKPEVGDVTDWQEMADQSSSALINFYWNNNKSYFNCYPAKADTPSEA